MKPRHVRGGWTRFSANQPALIGVAILLGLFLLAAAGPLVVGTDANAIDLRPEMHFAAPSRLHPFGTDDAGRDWFARALQGARVSLCVAVAGTVVSVTVGSLVGILAGYFGGVVDTVLMRAVDVMLSLPMFFAVLIAQALLTPSTWHLVWVLGLSSWMRVARILRSEVLVVGASEYLVASEALGARAHERIWRHVLPNVAGPIIVAATLAVGHAILSEAALSYLGMGVPLPKRRGETCLSAGSAACDSRHGSSFFQAR